MDKNVVIIGSGGREHAITWKISHSHWVKNIFVIPGSYAIGKIEKATNISIEPNNLEAISRFCKDNDVSIAIIGPEDPLAKGIADVLEKSKIKVFGPCKAGAQIESNKDWAKSFFDRHNIPTARWKSFTCSEEAKKFINNASFPALVVKASGLAAGKGVVVATSKQEACDAVDEILSKKKFGAAGESIVVEELLIGEEVSVLAFTDGKTIKAMLPAQDHKRIFDNDEGPNTGGMGAYCPCPLLDDEKMDYVQKHILQKTIEGFQKEKIPYVEAKKQLSFGEVIQREERHNSKKNDKLIGEMIALQNLPFDFVEGLGFRRLIQEIASIYNFRGRNFFTEFVCKELYGEIAIKFKELIKNFDDMSFTSDIWSDLSSNASLLSLTCHGIPRDFDRSSIVLKCEAFDDRHTAEKFDTMLTECNISNDLVQ